MRAPELIGVERLGQVIVGAGFEAGHEILRVVRAVSRIKYTGDGGGVARTRRHNSIHEWASSSRRSQELAARPMILAHASAPSWATSTSKPPAFECPPSSSVEVSE